MCTIAGAYHTVAMTVTVTVIVTTTFTMAGVTIVTVTVTMPPKQRREAFKRFACMPMLEELHA